MIFTPIETKLDFDSMSLHIIDEFFFFITEQVKRRGKLGGKQTQSLPEKVIFTLNKISFEHDQNQKCS